MPVPQSYFPRWTLTNGVQLSLWFESESECFWFVYRPPTATTPDFNGAGLSMQMGESYVTFRGGPEAYTIVCIQQMNARIRELWPELFGSAPPADDVPDEIEALGPQTVEVFQNLCSLRLVGNQLTGG